MSVGQIHHVYIVAETGAVGSRVILAEDIDRRPSPGRFYRARDYVNLRCVVLTEFPVRIGTRGVEVSQADRSDSIRTLEVRQRMLDGKLRLSVRIDRRRRMSLANGCLHRLAVDCAGRRKHELTTALCSHGREGANGSRHVV